MSVHAQSGDKMEICWRNVIQHLGKMNSHTRLLGRHVDSRGCWHMGSLGGSHCIMFARIIWSQFMTPFDLYSKELVWHKMVGKPLRRWQRRWRVCVSSSCKNPALNPPSWSQNTWIWSSGIKKSKEPSTLSLSSHWKCLFELLNVCLIRQSVIG